MSKKSTAYVAHMRRDSAARIHHDPECKMLQGADVESFDAAELPDHTPRCRYCTDTWTARDLKKVGQ